MNERMKELMIQAELDVILNQHAHEYGNGDMENTPYPEIEKFAELIVRKCIDIVGAGGEFASRPKLVEKLQEHFGVE